MSAKGCFVTVEGTEGAGKTTCLDHVQQRLEQAGKRVLRTREPGGTELGEEIRGLLLAHREQGMDPLAELLLMFAARREHLARRILPALDDGLWVLCDRFTDASFAYQGGGRGLDPERIRGLETAVQAGLRPDLTLLLDLPVALGLERAGRRSDPDRFEREQVAFFDRVRAAYRGIAATDPQRVRVIDAAGSAAEVRAAIDRELSGFLEARQ